MEILFLLAELQADSDIPVSQRLGEAIHGLLPGTQIVVPLSVADEALPRAVTSAATSGFPVTVLLYDGEAFRTKKSPAVNSATAPDYVAELEGAGARTVLMPTQGPMK